MAHPPIVFADPIVDNSHRLWTSGFAVVSYTAGRGGRGRYMEPNELRWISPTAHTLWIAAFALYPDTSWNGGAWNFRVGGITCEMLLQGGYINVSSTDSDRPLMQQVWNHLSVRVYRHTSAGTIDIWLNETNILSLTGQNTGGATADALSLTLADPGGNTGYVGDIFIAASDTATDEPYGDRGVLYQKPSGDGTHTDWDLGGGATADYSTLDNVPAGADYISTATVGERDTMAMADLPASMASIDALIPTWNALKSDAGTRSIAPTFRISGVDYDGTGQNLSMSAQSYQQVYGVSPATGVAWTVAEVNGLEAGVKLAT